MERRATTPKETGHHTQRDRSPHPKRPVTTHKETGHHTQRDRSPHQKRPVTTPKDRSPHTKTGHHTQKVHRHWPPSAAHSLGALLAELFFDALLSTQVHHLVVQTGQLVRVLAAVDDARPVSGPQRQLLQGTVCAERGHVREPEADGRGKTSKTPFGATNRRARG